MESAGQAGEVNISASTKKLLPNSYSFIERGKLPIKNLGELEMYFVEKPE